MRPLFILLSLFRECILVEGAGEASGTTGYRGLYGMPRRAGDCQNPDTLFHVRRPRLHGGLSWLSFFTTFVLKWWAEQPW